MFDITGTPSYCLVVRVCLQVVSLAMQGHEVTCLWLSVSL